MSKKKGGRLHETPHLCPVKLPPVGTITSSWAFLTKQIATAPNLNLPLDLFGSIREKY